MRTKFLSLILALVLAPFSALAHDGVMIGDMHTHETVASVDRAAVFGVIENHVNSEDAVIAVSTPRAERAELHMTETDENGVVKMRPVDRLIVPGNQTVNLVPGGAHVMLFGLNEPLKVGETFTLSISFEKDGVHEMPVTVRARDADHEMKHGDHAGHH